MSQTTGSRSSDPSPTETHGANPWKRFGARVRRARTQAGLSPDELTLGEVCSPAMLNAIEAGTRPPLRPTVSYLDRRLQAGGHLLDAWARATITDHLADNAPVEELHSDAEHIQEFQPGLIPEFFHTDAYAHALAQAAHPLGPSLPGAETDHARRVRRSPYTGGPPYFGVILDEAALRAVVGDAATTRAQLEHFQKFLRHGHVSLQVVPTGMRNHPCRTGPMRLLTFSPHHQLAYIPAPCGPGQLLTDPEPVHAYADLFTALAGAALPRDDSAELLATIIADLTHEPKAITSGRATTATPPRNENTPATTPEPIHLVST